MSQPCAFATCEQTSSVLCHCCNKNICLDHLSNPNSLIYYPSNSLTDQIKILDEQFDRLDINKLIEDGRQKLDEWCEDSFKKLNPKNLIDIMLKKSACHKKRINQARTNTVGLNTERDVSGLQKSTRGMKQEKDVIGEEDIRSLSIDNN